MERKFDLSINFSILLIRNFDSMRLNLNFLLVFPIANKSYPCWSPTLSLPFSRDGVTLNFSNFFSIVENLICNQFRFRIIQNSIIRYNFESLSFRKVEKLYTSPRIWQFILFIISSSNLFNRYTIEFVKFAKLHRSIKFFQPFVDPFLFSKNCSLFFFSRRIISSRIRKKIYVLTATRLSFNSSLTAKASRINTSG